MYVPFQDATALPAQVETPPYRYAGHELPAVDASAARDTEGRLHLALVNVDPHRRAAVTARIEGARVRAAEGRVLTAGAIDAHNTFERPDTVRPAPFKATRRGDALVFDLPPKSVVVVALRE